MRNISGPGGRNGRQRMCSLLPKSEEEDDGDNMLSGFRYNRRRRGNSRRKERSSNNNDYYSNHQASSGIDIAPVQSTCWQRFKSTVMDSTPTITVLTLSLCTLITVVFETDYEVLTFIRSAPEMIYLKYYYYEPAKQYLKAFAESLADNF